MCTFCLLAYFLPFFLLAEQRTRQARWFSMDESDCETVQQHVPCKDQVLIAICLCETCFTKFYVSPNTLWSIKLLARWRFFVILQRDSAEDSLKSNKIDMSGGRSHSHVPSVLVLSDVCWSPRVLAWFCKIYDFSSSAGMTDKRIDVDKHVLNIGEYGKNPASRHQIHKDSPIDRNHYMDKVSYFLSCYNSNGAFILSGLVFLVVRYFSTLYGTRMQLKDLMISKLKACGFKTSQSQLFFFFFTLSPFVHNEYISSGKSAIINIKSVKKKKKTIF